MTEPDGWSGLSGRPAPKPARTPRRVRTPISEAGERTPAGLACPKCGGTAFKAKRSRGAKLLLAPIPIAIAAAPKSRVRCVTCGTEYLRG